MELDQVHLACPTHKWTQKVTPNHELLFMNWIGGGVIVPKKINFKIDKEEQEEKDKEEKDFLRDWYLFWKKQLFSLNYFFTSWPEHG